MREPVTCCARCLRCRSSWTMMKPSVAKRNMPAAIRPRPPLVLPMVATSTIEPRLPSIGIAFISTPLAPSLGSIWGGGWSTICPVGISGASSRVPRSVVVNASPPATSGHVGRPSTGELPLPGAVDASRSLGKVDDVTTNAAADLAAERARPGRGARPGRARRRRRRRRRRGVRPPGRPRPRPRAVHPDRRAAARPTSRSSGPASGPATCWSPTTEPSRPRAVDAGRGREPGAAGAPTTAAHGSVAVARCRLRRLPAGWLRRHAPAPTGLRSATIAVLVAATVLGVLPVGQVRRAARRRRPGVRRRRRARGRLGPAAPSGCRWSSGSAALVAALAAAVARGRWAARPTRRSRCGSSPGAAALRADLDCARSPVRRRG